MAWLLFFTRCNASSVIFYSTHTENVIYLFYTMKIEMDYQRIWGHEKRKTSPLTWSVEADLSSSVYMCVSFNRSRSQPMKVHTAVTLLYNIGYIVNGLSPCVSYIYNTELLRLKSNEQNLKLKITTNGYIRMKIRYIPITLNESYCKVRGIIGR